MTYLPTQGWELTLPEVEETKPPESNVTPLDISAPVRCTRPTHDYGGRQDRIHLQREMVCELDLTQAILPDSMRFGEEAFKCSGAHAG